MATCDVCGCERTPEDKDYSPLQPLRREPCGWYSGSDGEMCGPDMDKLLGTR